MDCYWHKHLLNFLPWFRETDLSVPVISVKSNFLNFSTVTKNPAHQKFVTSRVRFTHFWAVIKSHVVLTCERDIAQCSESCHGTEERSASHTSASLASVLRESCRSANEPCHIHEWAMSHTWMSHVTYMNEPCHIYEWAMSHIWMSHVTCMNEPCHINE